MTDTQSLQERLHRICGHDSRDIEGCALCEAAAALAKLEDDLAEQKKLSAAISRDCNATALERNILRDSVAKLEEEKSELQSRLHSAESALAGIADTINSAHRNTAGMGDPDVSPLHDMREAIWQLSYQANSQKSRLAAYENQQWQPIETAPKDGTEIIAVIAGFLPTISHWYAPRQKWLTSTEEDHCDEDCWNGVLACMYSPTHWTPLLPVPAIEGNERLPDDEGEKNDR